jgi:hypothetical protein
VPTAQAIADLLETDLGGGLTRAPPRPLWRTSAPGGQASGRADAGGPTPAVRVEAARVGLEPMTPVALSCPPPTGADRQPRLPDARPDLDRRGYVAVAAVEEPSPLAQLGEAGQIVQLLVGLQPLPQRPCPRSRWPPWLMTSRWRATGTLVTDHADAAHRSA